MKIELSQGFAASLLALIALLVAQAASDGGSDSGFNATCLAYYSQLIAGE